MMHSGGGGPSLRAHDHSMAFSPFARTRVWEVLRLTESSGQSHDQRGECRLGMIFNVLIVELNLEANSAAWLILHQEVEMAVREGFEPSVADKATHL